MLLFLAVCCLSFVLLDMPCVSPFDSGMLLIFFPVQIRLGEREDQSPDERAVRSSKSFLLLLIYYGRAEYLQEDDMARTRLYQVCPFARVLGDKSCNLEKVEMVANTDDEVLLSMVYKYETCIMLPPHPYMQPGNRSMKSG